MGKLVGIISQIEQGLVARRIAIGFKVVGSALGVAGQQAAGLLGAVAVGGGEAACKSAICHLNLSANNGKGAILCSPRLDPLRHAGRHYAHFFATGYALLEQRYHIGAFVLGEHWRKTAAKRLELLLRHAAKEVGEEALLHPAGLAESALHANQPWQVQQQSPEHSPKPMGMADEEQEAVALDERAVEVKGSDSTHILYI